MYGKTRLTGIFNRSTATVSDEGTVRLLLDIIAA